MSRFTSALVVSPLADGKTWVLLETFGYDVGELGSGDSVEVAAGFCTDFASIPRIFWAVLPRWGKYGNAAVVHDWLYWKQRRSRRASDDIMLEAMGVLSVPVYQKYPIYWAVRAFGWIAWRRNQWDRQANLERVIPCKTLEATQESQRPGLMTRTWRPVGPSARIRRSAPATWGSCFLR